MKVTGIIAEYNPFHNGHKYHIEKAREITDADYCIVIMSGNFTQRGEPALMDKYLRSKMALECGADLVLELPVCYACASAPYFATGAVALLDKLGVTDYVVFGSESGNISAIQEIAQILTDEPALYTSSLKNHLKSGHSYPAAQNLALTDCFGQQKTLDTGLLSSPNNLLGIEYCKALFARKSFIKPITITRQGSEYSDTVLHQENSSALAIRTALCAASENGLQSALESIRTQVPDYAFSLMQEHYKKVFPIFPDTLSAPLHYKLLLEAETGFISYLDINEELSERICNHLPDYQNFSSFCMLLKTKELTYTRISRSLLHILLDIRKADMELYRANDWISYGRILGFRMDSTPLLSAIKANASIPLIPKLADACKYLDESAMTQLKKDIQAAHIYNSFVQHTYGTKLPVEMQRQILRS